MWAVRGRQMATKMFNDNNDDDDETGFKSVSAMIGKTENKCCHIAKK